MIKSILVCLDGSSHSDAACDLALHLTSRLQARLLGLHVLDSRMLEGPLMADLSGWIGAQPYGAQLQQFRELMEQKGQAVVRAFDDRCAKAGVQAESWLKMGHPARVILEEEARAELLVLGQRGEHADWMGDMTGSTVERVVRHSVKPCIVVPDTFTPFTRILAAYDGSSHAGQALREAAELAVALDLEIVVLTVAESEDQDKAAAISKDAMGLVGAHGARAHPRVARGRSAVTILECAQQDQCNLIVVGAYGHSRVREMILGSTTTTLVTRSRVPVMLVR
ncbi:MAG: universal stress protein [Verrucomicrobia bacterium]|nr:universal stress protein [Verrucomicrobiota bacterium]MBU1909089.1 universal stress protein [Verrucomicrobiota bacterium]